MSTVESIESLNATLEPLEALRGEHDQLEEWVNDSFQSLEKLHEDLSIWQAELARKQTEIDLREDAVNRSRHPDSVPSEELARLGEDIEVIHQENQQLEEENAEQLQVLEEVESRCAVLAEELGSANHRTEELAAALESARLQASSEQSRWKDEFRELRRLMETQHTLLTDRVATTPESVPPVSTGETNVGSRAAELRKRAESRRAAKQRGQGSFKEPNDP